MIGPAEFGLPHLDTAMRRARLALFAALVAGAAPAAEPAALRIAAHPLERAAGGPAELDAALRPAAGPGPHPAVVLLHGCAGMRGADGAIRARDAQWGELLAGLGFVVLHVDSFAPRGETAICAQRDDSRRIRVSAERARDAYAALAYLQTRPDIRPDAVAPVLLLVGEADDWTPAPPCAALAARAGGAVELRLYPGAYHDFDAPGLEPRRRRGVGATPDGTAMLGTDPAARADALRRVPDFLARLAPPR